MNPQQCFERKCVTKIMVLGVPAPCLSAELYGAQQGADCVREPRAGIGASNEPQQQHERVTVALDRMLAGPAYARKMIRREATQSTAKRSGEAVFIVHLQC